MKSKVCWGHGENGVHVKACRPGRPLCKMRRKGPKYGPCECGAYPFTHRTGSGFCGKPERLWALLDQPLRRGAAVHWGTE